MPVIRQIAQLGNPVLRNQSAEVVDVKGEEVKTIARDMLFTLADIGGMGIAAPQVYENIRIIVIASKPTKNYPDAPLMEPCVMINPEITRFFGATLKEWEGCLSVPGIRGLVPRMEGVEVRYCDLLGEKAQMSLNGFPARIVQHEIDHLDGLCFLDRMETTRDIVTEQEFARIIKS